MITLSYDQDGSSVVKVSLENVDDVQAGDRSLEELEREVFFLLDEANSSSSVASPMQTSQNECRARTYESILEVVSSLRDDIEPLSANGS